LLGEDSCSSIEQIPCDMMLIQGKCVANESILTGESVPVIKLPVHELSNEIYNLRDEAAKKHTIFSGCRLM
jgi:P-type E1-E2 ATPase